MLIVFGIAFAAALALGFIAAFEAFETLAKEITVWFSLIILGIVLFLAIASNSFLVLLVAAPGVLAVTAVSWRIGNATGGLITPTPQERETTRTLQTFD